MLYHGMTIQHGIIKESTPSLVNWHKFNKIKRPGMHLLSSLQGVAARANNDFDTEFFTKIINDLEIKSVINTELPLGVTAQMRTDGENDYVFVMNFSEESKSIKEIIAKVKVNLLYRLTLKYLINNINILSFIYFNIFMLYKIINNNFRHFY